MAERERLANPSKAPQQLTPPLLQVLTNFRQQLAWAKRSSHHSPPQCILFFTAEGVRGDRDDRD
jgi:hypothetical protein